MGFDVEITEISNGFVSFLVSGEKGEQLFSNESGGHRWQRVPPNERSGRVHTSTITVAVLPERTQLDFDIKNSDITWTMTKGSGPGGQHRNKVETAVILKHIPSGLIVRCETERSQYRNKELALRILKARLTHQQTETIQKAESANRKEQVGSGERGDKRRTIRVKDGRVKDHITGKSWNLKDYLNGNW